jgi:hypothetical protein
MNDDKFRIQSPRRPVAWVMSMGASSTAPAASSQQGDLKAVEVSEGRLAWCGGRLAEEFGPQYLGGFMGQWRCFRCGREAPFSWWRSFVIAAGEEILARSWPLKDLLAGHGPVESCGAGSVAA